MKKILFMLCVICTLSACGVEQVDTGNRGVKTVWGEVVGESLPEGLYFYNPFSTTIHEMNCKTVKNVYNFETYIYLSFVATITLPMDVVLNLHFRI